MDNEVDAMKAVMEEKFDSIPPNTEIKDEEKQLKFAKLQLPASVVDFLIEHYGFFDLVELNQMALYILKSIALMEKDGFKLAAYKNTDGKHEAFELTIEELIAKFRIGLAGALKKEEPYNPDVKVVEKDKNEKNNL